MQGSYSFHSRLVSPEHLLEVTTALAQSQRDLSLDDIEEMLDESERDTRSLVNLGQELNLIDESDGGYTASSNIALQVRQANHEEEKQEILKIQLQKYRPFITFIKNLLDGLETDQAARQVGIFYQMGTDEEVIEAQLLHLGEYANILIDEGSEWGYNFDSEILSRNYFQTLSSQLEDELVARLFLENRFDEDIIAYIDNESFNQLVASLRNFGSDPDDAIGAAARAVETFQRNIGGDYGSGDVDFQGPNGIRELAQALESDDLTQDRHQLAAEYIGEVRNNTGGHGIDPETGKHWNISGEVAFSFILMSVHYMRSIYRWVVDDQLIV